MDYPDMLQEFEKQKSEKSRSAESRLRSLCDPGSFVEFNRFVCSKEGCAVCCGFARIDGRPVFVYSFNHDIDCGALSVRAADSLTELFDKAVSTGTPVVGIVASDGAKLSEGLDAAGSYGRVIRSAARMSGIVPHIVAVEGAALGATAMFVRCADLVIINDKARLGMGTTDECMLSAQEAFRCGYASVLANNDFTVDDAIRRLLAYLPENNLMQSERVEPTDDINRKCVGLDPDNFDIDSVISQVFDSGSFTGLYSDFGTDTVCGLARMGGVAVGVIANAQPLITGSGSRKCAALLSLCNAYSMPVVVLCDAEGFMSDSSSEREGVLLPDTALAAAFADADCPIITVILSRALGSAFAVMGSKSIGADAVFAWVGAEIGLVKAETAVAMQGGSELDKYEDPISGRKELIEKYRQEKMSVFAAAEAGYIDQPILPEDTRAYICSAIDCMMDKKPAARYRKNPVRVL